MNRDKDDGREIRSENEEAEEETVTGAASTLSQAIINLLTAEFNRNKGNLQLDIPYLVEDGQFILNMGDKWFDVLPNIVSREELMAALLEAYKYIFKRGDPAATISEIIDTGIKFEAKVAVIN